MDFRYPFKKVLFTLFLTLFAFSSTKVGLTLVDQYRAEQLYQDMTTIYDESQNQTQSQSQEETEENPNAERVEDDKRDEESKQLQSSLLSINEDVVGWITIPNTKINYPVVQTEDNDYYLKHNMERQASDHGSIFVDFRNKGLTDRINSERNIVIYGHNMLDGAMFSDLEQYKKENFFKANQVISFDVFPKTYRWQAFSAYVTSTDFNYIQTNFKDDAEFKEFLKKISEKSKYQTDNAPEYTGPILTLSTCSYEFDNARFVVHYKLVD